MNNNYEFIQVDPKVIAMLGGDESSILNEDLEADLPASALDNFTMQPKTPAPVENNMNFGDKYEYLLNEILSELKEIKVILAGKE